MVKEVLTYTVQVTIEDDSDEPFTEESLDQASNLIREYIKDIVNVKSIDDEKFWTNMDIKVIETY